MDNKTIKLLNKYNPNTKILSISNNNICGILDLDNFNLLEELDCSFNKITQIIYQMD